MAPPGGHETQASLDTRRLADCILDIAVGARGPWAPGVESAVTIIPLEDPGQSAAQLGSARLAAAASAGLDDSCCAGVLDQGRADGLSGAGDSCVIAAGPSQARGT